jgi:hypothetical protein
MTKKIIKRGDLRLKITQNHPSGWMNEKEGLERKYNFSDKRKLGSDKKN